MYYGSAFLDCWGSLWGSVVVEGTTVRDADGSACAKGEMATWTTSFAARSTVAALTPTVVRGRDDASRVGGRGFNRVFVSS